MMGAATTGRAHVAAVKTMRTDRTIRPSGRSLSVIGLPVRRDPYPHAKLRVCAIQGGGEIFHHDHSLTVGHP
jgi:hypothetical protein